MTERETASVQGEGRTDQWASCATCNGTSGHHSDDCQEQRGGYPPLRRKPTVPAPSHEADLRFVAASAVRDWIHEQPFSLCNMGADTCPDWTMAFEIRDVVFAAIDLPRVRAEERAATLREVAPLCEFVESLAAEDPATVSKYHAIGAVLLARDALAAHFNQEADKTNAPP